jgi:hypothetical protein
MAGMWRQSTNEPDLDLAKDFFSPGASVSWPLALLVQLMEKAGVSAGPLNTGGDNTMINASRRAGPEG